MFMCQRDSYLTELETEVMSCELIGDIENAVSKLSIDPKELTDKSLYKLILKDTILFPEGGGQPDDRGKINEDGNVVRVVRSGTHAEHYVTKSHMIKEAISRGEATSPGSSTPTIDTPWNKGDKVLTKIDWCRRFDHMQQHSGQHLITAVADNLFGFPTTSWWLGSEDCNIELDTKDITQEQLETLEKVVNSKIRESVPVTVDVVELDDPKLKLARGRNIPEDIKSDIRIVSVAGVESNVCCGTHVTNLSQLQVIKLLHVVKKKGKCLLYFVCGNRVIQKFSNIYRREQLLTESLRTSPADLPSAADKLNIALKNSRKSNQVLSKELAAFVAKDFKSKSDGPKLWSYHRDNMDLDFGMALLREIGDPGSTVLLITIKTEGNSGYLLLTAGESNVDKQTLTQMGEQFCTILDGKGSLQRGNLYQAKVNKINQVNKVQKLAVELIEKL